MARVMHRLHWHSSAPFSFLSSLLSCFRLYRFQLLAQSIIMRLFEELFEDWPEDVLQIQFRIQQKKSKVWLTLPYVFLKAFKKCRRGERKRNRGNPFAIVAAAASLSILYVNKCIIIVLENLPKCLNSWILVPKTKKENVLEKFGQFWTKDNFLVNFKGTIFDVLGQFVDQRLILGLFGHFGNFFIPFCKFTFVEETSFFVNTLTIHLITKRYIK